MGQIRKKSFFQLLMRNVFTNFYPGVISLHPDHLLNFTVFLPSGKVSQQRTRLLTITAARQINELPDIVLEISGIRNTPIPNPEDHRMLGGAYPFTLTVKFLCQFFPWPQTHVLDLEFLAWLQARESNQLLGKGFDPHRIPHLQIIEAAGLPRGSCPEHQTHRLGQRHKIPIDFMVASK
jgi:hypothetical protein